MSEFRAQFHEKPDAGHSAPGKGNQRHIVRSVRLVGKSDCASPRRSL